MNKIILWKKWVSLISRNGIFLRLILSPCTGLTGLKILLVLNIELDLLNKLSLFQEPMKNVACFLKEILMISLQKNSIIYILALFKLLLNLLLKKCINASVLICLRDARFKKSHDSIRGMITTSLYDSLVYFDCYPDISLALDDPNIVKVLTLNVLTSGYDVDEGSKPFALIYHIHYRLLGTQFNPYARIRDPEGKTMLIQCSTPDAKVQIPKMI